MGNLLRHLRRSLQGRVNESVGQQIGPGNARHESVNTHTKYLSQENESNLHKE